MLFLFLIRLVTWLRHCKTLFSSGCAHHDDMHVQIGVLSMCQQQQWGGMILLGVDKWSMPVWTALYGTMQEGLPGFWCIGEPDCSSCSWNETDPLRAKFKNLVQFLPAAQQSPFRLTFVGWHITLQDCMEFVKLESITAWYWYNITSSVGIRLCWLVPGMISWRASDRPANHCLM